MVSMRVLEREQIIQAINRDDVDWERIRTNVMFTLRRRGFNRDRAEELSQAAIVAVYSGNEMISEKRAATDCMAEAYGILHREAAERSQTGQTLPDGIEVGERRYVDQRGSYETTTADVRNGVKALRTQRRLFDQYAWLISLTVWNVVPDAPLMRYLGDMAYSAYGYCQDTTQLPPNTRRTVYHKPESFVEREISDRDLCRSVSQQFWDNVPFRVGSVRESVLLQMLHG